VNKIQAAGSYCEVGFTPYQTSRIGRNIYGEFISIPVYETFVSHGATIEVAQPVESFPSNFDFDDFLEF
jgi:hypothetical protein